MGTPTCCANASTGLWGIERPQARHRGIPMHPSTTTAGHRCEFPIGRPAVCDSISDVDAYQGRWPSSRIFDATGLVAREEWRCDVQPALPYPLRSLRELNLGPGVTPGPAHRLLRS